MAEIRASYRRTFQVRPYETETVELSVLDEVEQIDVASGTTAEKLAAAAGDYHAALAEVGDTVVLDRMARAPQVKIDAPRVDKDPWAPIIDRKTGKEWRPESGGAP